MSIFEKAGDLMKIKVVNTRVQCLSHLDEKCNQRTIKDSVFVYQFIIIKHIEHENRIMDL